MYARVIGSGLRLLIAAALYSLSALPAAAHPGHRHDTTAVIAVAADDTLVSRASSSDVEQGAQVIAAPAPALVSSFCCCGQSGCCASSGCGLGMTCGSCGASGNALVVSHAVRVASPAKAAIACLSDQLLAGDAASPDDRPPRV